MFGALSTSNALSEFEQIQILNEILDKNISEFSLDDSIFDNDYTHLVNPGTHVIDGVVVPPQPPPLPLPQNQLLFNHSIFSETLHLDRLEVKYIKGQSTQQRF
jgi:hypothetical protein